MGDRGQPGHDQCLRTGRWPARPHVAGDRLGTRKGSEDRLADHPGVNMGVSILHMG